MTIICLASHSIKLELGLAFRPLVLVLVCGDNIHCPSEQGPPSLSSGVDLGASARPVAGSREDQISEVCSLQPQRPSFTLSVSPTILATESL